MREQNGRRQRALGQKERTALALAAYAAGFALVALAHAWPFIRDGRYFIYGADAYTQHFPAFCYALEYWKGYLAGLLQGRLMPQLYSFSLGLGGDIFSTLHYYGLANPFYLLALGVHTENLPLAFSLITVLQLFLGGAGFYAFCRKLAAPDESRAGAVVGAWLYIFTGFYPLAVEHPIMAHAVFYLPLLLLGCEKVLRRESPLPLALSVFFMALTGFYFLFICSVALAFYVLLRVWAMGQKPWWRAALLGAVRSLAAYLAGLCMAGPIFLPGVLGYLNSTRADGGDVFSLQMLFSDLGTLCSWPMGIADTASFWYAGAIGLLAVALCLFAPGARRSWPLIAGFAVSAVVIVSPLVQKALVGFGKTSQTRFWFVLQFLWAFAAACCWPRLEELSRRQLLAGAGAAVLFLLLCILNDAGAAQWIWLGFFAGSLLPLIAFQKQAAVQDGAWALRKGKLCGLLAVLVLLQPALALYADSTRRAPSYRNERFAWQMPAVTARTLPEGEYRVDVSDVGLHRWWASGNIPLVGGYKGISEYFSILNLYYANAMLHDWALMPAQQGTFSFQGLDGCMALNTLAGVKYVFVRPGEEEYLPYAHNLEQQPAGPAPEQESENSILQYSSYYALPLGYAYTSALSAEQYASLNGLQKQAAMMYAVALADGDLPEGFAAEPETAGVHILPYVLEEDGASWKDGVVNTAADRGEGALVLRFVLDGSCEVHLELNGFKVLSDRLSSRLSFCMDGGLERETYPYTVDEESCWVNLGQAGPGEHTVTIALTSENRFALKDLEVWGYSTAEYEAAAYLRSRTVLQNVVADTNSLAGLLQAETDTLLCLSIPYSTGWHAVIDGQPAPLRRANSMFMALEVPAGEHVIGLYYITPGLKYGLMLSALGTLALAAQLLWYHRKKLPGSRAGR